MAKPCRYQLPGTDTWMSESEFKKVLNDGLIDEHINSGIISIRNFKPKAVTAPVATETAVETTATPVAETKEDGKYFIDGKEVSEEEAIKEYQNQSRQERFNLSGKKIEYQGSNEQAIRATKEHNESISPFNKDGKLKFSYIDAAIRKAFGSVSFKKFGDAYRKHIDPSFSRANNETRVGGRVGKNMSWQELASYVIGDGRELATEEQFRAFAKELGLEVPTQETTKETPVEPVVETKAPEVKQESPLDEELSRAIIDMETIEEEIAIEKDNIREEKERIKEEKAKVRASKMPKAEKQDKLEDLDAELEDYIDNAEATIEYYQMDLKDAKSRVKKLENRKAKEQTTQEAKPKTEPVAKEETPKYEAKKAPKKMVAPGRTKSAFDRNFTVEISADGTTATVQGEPIETADGRILTPPKETAKITTNVNGERVAITSKGDTVYLDRAQEVEEKQVEAEGKTPAEIKEEYIALAKESNGDYAIVYTRGGDAVVYKKNRRTGKWQGLTGKGEWVDVNDDMNRKANDAVNYTRKDRKTVKISTVKNGVTSVDDFVFDFNDNKWKKLSEDGSLSYAGDNLAKAAEKQFVKENPKRAPKTKEEIKEVISDIIDAAKFDTKNKAVSSLIPPNLWNKILDLVKEALLTGVDFTFAINDAAKKVFDKAVADGEITEQQAGEYIDEINNDKASRINGLSSIKNEFVSETAKKIASIGMENMSIQEMVDLAEQAIKNGEINPRDLVQSLIDNPRPATPIEQVVLNYSKVQMLNELDDLYRQLKDVNSDSEKSNIEAKIKNIEDDLLKHEVSSTISGSQTGLSLSLRRMMMNSQYNLFLPQIEKIYRDAGKEMPADLKKEIEEAQKELRRLNREIENKRKQSQESQEEEAVKNIKNSGSKRNSGKKITSKDGKISVSIDSIRKAVADGAQTIEDVIEAVRSEVIAEHPNATDRQIRDAISNYGKEVGKTKTDLDKEIDRIRAVGRMISKLEDIQKQLATKVGKIKNERNKRAVQKVLTDRERELKRAIREAMSDIPMTEDEIAEIESNNLEAYKNSLKNRNAELKRRIKDGDFSTQPKSKFQELDQEARELELERQELIDKLEYEKTKAILQTQSDLKKLERYIIEALNLPKGLIASVDLSAPFRQGVIGMMTQSPKKSWNQLVQMWEFWKNPSVYDKWLSAIKSSEFYPLMKASGLHIAEQNGELLEMEEAFMSNLGNKIPIFGQSYNAKGVKVPGLNIYKRSDAAYTGFLNNMRVQMFIEGADLLKQQGYTMSSNPKVFKDWAKFCNTATGRGQIQSQKELTKSAISLSAAFFSPRLIKARLEVLGLSPGYYYSMDPASRAMALKTMGRFIASTSLLIGAMALWYNNDDDDKTNVELDPRSSDFLKVKDGNTRVDLTGGMSIYHRTIYQFLRGQKKNTTTGEIKQLNKDFGGTTRFDVVKQFFANKLAPLPSKIYKWSDMTEDQRLKEIKQQENKDVIFNRVGMPVWLQDLTVPLWMRDVEPIMKEQGYGAGAFLIGLSLLGEGVQYQEPRAGSSSNTISDFNDIQDFDSFEDPFNEMDKKLGF